MKWMNNASFEILSWTYKIWKNMMDIDGPIDPFVVDLPPVAKWKLCKRKGAGCLGEALDLPSGYLT